MLLYCALELSWSFAPMVNDCRGPSKYAFRLVDVGRGQRRPQIFQAHAVGGQRRGIRPDPHRRLLSAADETSPTPGSWEIFCASAVSARSSTFESGNVSEVSASVRMGESAGFTLL